MIVTALACLVLGEGLLGRRGLRRQIAGTLAGRSCSGAVAGALVAGLPSGTLSSRPLCSCLAHWEAALVGTAAPPNRAGGPGRMTAPRWSSRTCTYFSRHSNEQRALQGVDLTMQERDSWS